MRRFVGCACVGGFMPKNLRADRRGRLRQNHPFFTGFEGWVVLPRRHRRDEGQAMLFSYAKALQPKRGAKLTPGVCFYRVRLATSTYRGRFVILD